MYNIAICDDEVKTLDNITKTIKNEFLNFNIEGQFFTTNKPEELVGVLEKEKMDILFLDIDMPKISGLDIGEYLLNKQEDIILIFVTSHDALVYKSFKYHPFGFIRKSHFNEEISQVIHSVSEKLKQNNDSLIIKVNSDVVKINLNDILYFEGEANYVNLYTNDNNYRFRETLGSLESQLINKGFLRVHKGYLISAKEVFLFNSKEVKLNDGTLVPIGRSYSESVKKELLKHMR